MDLEHLADILGKYHQENNQSLFESGPAKAVIKSHLRETNLQIKKGIDVTFFYMSFTAFFSYEDIVAESGYQDDIELILENLTEPIPDKE